MTRTPIARSRKSTPLKGMLPVLFRNVLTTTLAYPAKAITLVNRGQSKKFPNCHLETPTVESQCQAFVLACDAASNGPQNGPIAAGKKGLPADTQFRIYQKPPLINTIAANNMIVDAVLPSALESEPRTSHHTNIAALGIM